MLIAAACVAGYLGMRTFAATGPRLTTRPSRPSVPVASPQQAEVRPIYVYVPKVAQNEASLVPAKYWVRRDADPKTAAIKKLLAVGQTDEYAGLIPAGTRLLSLSVGRGLATVDLSREFVDGFSGGSLQESLTLGALVRTLSQFRDIDRVQILVEGRTVDTLGGHFGIAEPLSYKSTQIGSGRASE